MFRRAMVIPESTRSRTTPAENVAGPIVHTNLVLSIGFPLPPAVAPAGRRPIQPFSMYGAPLF